MTFYVFTVALTLGTIRYESAIICDFNTLNTSSLKRSLKGWNDEIKRIA